MSKAMFVLSGAASTEDLVDRLRSEILPGAVARSGIVATAIHLPLPDEAVTGDVPIQAIVSVWTDNPGSYMSPLAVLPGIEHLKLQIAGADVVESIAKDDGLESSADDVRVLSMLAARMAVPERAAATYWRTTHAPLVVAEFPSVCGYIQNIVTGPLTDVEFPWFGIGESRFADADAARRTIDPSEATERLTVDARRFVDLTSTITLLATREVFGEVSLARAS